MSRHVTMSRQTRLNWLIEAAVFVSAMVAALSGLCFLYVPSADTRVAATPCMV
jgi:hypothetical protein